MTREQYDSKIKEQNGKCAICGTDDPGAGVVHWAVDHDHDTKRNRGLLCRACNLALGGFKDSVAVLQKAIDYLRSYSCQS